MCNDPAQVILLHLRSWLADRKCLEIRLSLRKGKRHILRCRNGHRLTVDFPEGLEANSTCFLESMTQPGMYIMADKEVILSIL